WSAERTIRQSENERRERRSTVRICPSVFPLSTNSETPEYWQTARQILPKHKPTPTPKPTPVRKPVPLPQKDGPLCGPSSWIMVREAPHEFVGFAGLCASRVWLMIRRANHETDPLCLHDALPICKNLPFGLPSEHKFRNTRILADRQANT